MCVCVLRYQCKRKRPVFVRPSTFPLCLRHTLRCCALGERHVTRRRFIYNNWDPAPHAFPPYYIHNIYLIPTLSRNQINHYTTCINRIKLDSIHSGDLLKGFIDIPGRRSCERNIKNNLWRIEINRRNFERTCRSNRTKKKTEITENCTQIRIYHFEDSQRTLRPYIYKKKKTLRSDFFAIISTNGTLRTFHRATGNASPDTDSFYAPFEADNRELVGRGAELSFGRYYPYSFACMRTVNSCASIQQWALF